MTGQESFDLMVLAKKYLAFSFRKNVSNVVFDEELNVGSGSFSEIKNEAEVGVKEFKIYPDQEFSDYKVTEGVISVFHEACGHGLQHALEFQKKNDTSKVLARSDYACNASAQYYGIEFRPVTIKGVKYLQQRMSDRYFDHPHELAAEYAGIKVGYQFLTDVYGVDKANRMVCGYVNERVKQNWSFVHSKRPYTRIQDVLDDFREEFPKCAFRHKQYAPVKDKYGMLYQYAMMERNPYLVMHSQAGMNGIKQDSILAASFVCCNGLSKYDLPPAMEDLETDVAKSVKRYTKAAVPKIRKENLELSNLDRLLEQTVIWEQEGAESNIMDDFEF